MAAKEKLSLEQYLEACGAGCADFVQELHDLIVSRKGKAEFVVQKTSLLGSFKHKQKSVFNTLLKEFGLVVRIYGENIADYPEFLDFLPVEMVDAISESGDCKWLTQGKCSPKCGGYDFNIAGAHFQKCRYNCFEFLATDTSKPYIKAFVEHELTRRVNV